MNRLVIRQRWIPSSYLVLEPALRLSKKSVRTLGEIKNFGKFVKAADSPRRRQTVVVRLQRISFCISLGNNVDFWSTGYCKFVSVLVTENPDCQCTIEKLPYYRYIRCCELCYEILNQTNS